MFLILFYPIFSLFWGLYRFILTSTFLIVNWLDHCPNGWHCFKPGAANLFCIEVRDSEIPSLDYVTCSLIKTQASPVSSNIRSYVWQVFGREISKVYHGHDTEVLASQFLNASCPIRGHQKSSMTTRHGYKENIFPHKAFQNLLWGL